MRLFLLRWYARRWAREHGCKIAIVRGTSHAILEVRQSGRRFSTGLVQGKNLPLFGIPALGRALDYQLRKAQAEAPKHSDHILAADLLRKAEDCQ